MPLLLLQSVVSDAIDVVVVLAFFLDLQKAFHTVNHHTLRYKLGNYGVKDFYLTLVHWYYFKNPPIY